MLEGHRVFTSLSVEDNLLIGTYAQHPHGDRSKLDRIYEMFPEIAEKRHQLATRLSGGQQQILAVAQGLIGEPKLLILDEPSAGLAPVVIDRILNVAASESARGVAILLVEQLVDKALRHADFCYVIETGRIALAATPAELRGSDALKHIYLGSKRQRPRPAAVAAKSENAPNSRVPAQETEPPRPTPDARGRAVEFLSFRCP